MALTIVEAHAATYTPSPTTETWTLTPPGNAVGLLVAATHTPDAVTYGGVALSLVTYESSGHVLGLYELLDLSGASGTDLVIVTSPWDGTLTEAAWLCADNAAERVDADAATHVSNATTFTLDPAGEADCVAYVAGTLARAGSNPATNLSPYGSQTELSEVGGGGALSPPIFNASWLGGISTATVVGTANANPSGVTGNTVAGLYFEAATRLEPDAFGAEAGFQAGVTIGTESTINLGVNTWGAEAGLETIGLIIDVPLPRQVALVGGGEEMPSRTAGGTEGQFLQQHVDRQPSWEDMPAATIEVAEADGAPDVSGVSRVEFDGATVTDDGGGQVTVTVTAASSLEVAEADGAPDVSGVSRVEFDGATVTDDGGGQVTVTIVPGSSLAVAEADGAPDVSGVERIEFSGATVTDDGGGQVTVAVTAGASLTVEEADGSPSVASVDTIVFPDGTVTDLTGGAVSVREVPTGVIGASVYKSADQTNIASSNHTKVTFDSTLWDTNGIFDNANDRFVIPAGMGGKWLFTGTVAVMDAATMTDAILSLYKNGAIDRVLFRGNVAGDWTLPFAHQLTLVAGDYIQLYVNPGSASTADVRSGVAWTTFQCYKLGSGNVSGLDTARKVRTSGSLTLNSTSWADVDNGLDLVTPAQAGDVLLVEVSGLMGNEAVSGILDAATIVAGNPVNYVSLGAGGASHFGVLAWVGPNGATGNVAGGIQYVVQAGDISSGNITLRLRYRTNAATNKTLNATSDIPLAWSVVNLRGGAASRDVGYEFAYAEFTAVVSVASTTEGSPTNVVSAPAVVFDGNTRVCIEFYSVEVSGDTDGTVVHCNLWDGSTDLGRVAMFNGERGTDWRKAVMVRRYLTPTAGSHTYHWKSHKGAAVTVDIGAGAGGSGTRMPGYIRVTKA